MKITAFHQEYFCKKCGSPLGDPASAEYLQDEIYLYYVCLKCLVHHCAYFTIANFVSFPKDETHLTKRAPDLGWACGKCKTNTADGVSVCGFSDPPRLSG